MKGLMKKLSLSIATIAIVAVGWSAAKEQVLGNKQDGNAAPLVVVKLVSSVEVAYPRNHVPLKVTFENVSDKRVRLLRVFKPTVVFFNISSMMERTNKYISVPKMIVKPETPAELRRPDSWQYLELEPNESFTTQIDVSDLLPPNLEEGLYEISLTYHNEYGENCFKGTRTTEGAWVSIIEEPVKNVIGSISEERALQIAKKAFTGKDDLKIAIRSTSKQFIVTFGGPPKPGPAGTVRTGGDFAAQVYINRFTGEVEKMIGS